MAVAVESATAIEQRAEDVEIGSSILMLDPFDGEARWTEVVDVIWNQSGRSVILRGAGRGDIFPARDCRCRQPLLVKREAA